MLSKQFWTDEQRRQITDARLQRRKEALLELKRIVLSDQDQNVTLQVLQRISNGVCYLTCYLIFDTLSIHFFLLMVATV